MTTMQTAPSLASLADALRGELIAPGDAAYDEARRVWNGMFDRRPAAIARVEEAVDVATVVAFARETGMELAVRGGGHSSAGYSTVDGGIVIDLSRMKGVWVDPRAKVAVAQAGALWGDVDRETQAHGLAVPGGQISHTGIAGLTLGGGIGWLSRQHGLTIDNLLSVELVTADGRLVTASETEIPNSSGACVVDPATSEWPCPSSTGCTTSGRSCSVGRSSTSWMMPRQPSGTHGTSSPTRPTRSPCGSC
jgi:FAD/FMN-containing dehydrogenase